MIAIGRGAKRSSIYVKSVDETYLGQYLEQATIKTLALRKKMPQGSGAFSDSAPLDVTTHPVAQAT